MTVTWHTEGGALWAEKPAAAAQSFPLPWELDGDTIATSTWAAAAGITVGATGKTDTTTTAVISGGVAGQWYQVTNTIVTAAGQTLQQAFHLFITALPAAIGTGIKSVFADLPGTIASLRRDRLAGMLESYAPGALVSDDYLLEKLVSAERALERDLRVFFTPREMVTPATPQAERDALVAAGNQVVEEPGYDYDPALFAGNTWGLIELRQRPAISVSRIGFYYPAPISLVYEVPLDWVRLDKKVGRISLVPTQTVLSLPLNAFILSAIGGGRNIPLMLHVRYRAGLENAATEWPDLLTVIKRQAMLDILGDRFVPSSGSVSADGLSQSISFEASKYQDEVDHKVEKLRSAIHGIRMMVM